MIFGNEYKTDQQYICRMVFFSGNDKDDNDDDSILLPRKYVMRCAHRNVILQCRRRHSKFYCCLEKGFSIRNLKTCHQLLLWFPNKVDQSLRCFFFFALAYRWPYTHIYIESIVKTKRTSIQIAVNQLLNKLRRKKREKKQQQQQNVVQGQSTQ